MKHLILMRHAKSDWSEGGLTDFQRPLNKRGALDARKMGAWLASTIDDVVPYPSIIYCSSARRTQQTMQLMLLAMQSTGVETQNIKQHILDSLYLASSEAIVDLIRQALAEQASLMLIGHNPGLENALLHFCPDVLPTSNNKLLTTANIAIIEFDDLFNAQLLTLKRPKSLLKSSPKSPSKSL